MANISLNGVKNTGLSAPVLSKTTNNNRIKNDNDININQDYIEVNYSDPNAETLINPNAYIEHPMQKYMKTDINPYAQGVELENVRAEAAALVVSIFFGILEVVENIGDALIMTEAFISVAEASIFHPGDVERIKKTASDVVEFDWTEKLYDASVDAMGIDYESSHGIAHSMGTVGGTMLGYTALSIGTSGAGAVVNAAVGGLSAMGSSSERALQSGATFEQAEITGLVAGGLGAATGVASEKIRVSAGGARSIGDIAKYTAAGAGIAASEPITNSAAEYIIYGRNNSDFDNVFDYYMNNGGFQSTLMAAGIGGASVAVKATKGYVDNNKTNAATLEEIKLSEASVELNEHSSVGNKIIVSSSDDYSKLSVEQKEIIDTFHNMMINDKVSDPDAIEGFERQLIYSMASGNKDAEKVMNKLIEYNNFGRKIHYRNLSNYPWEGNVSCYKDDLNIIFIEEHYVDGSNERALSVYFHETGHFLHISAIGDSVPDDWEFIKTNTQKRISQVNKDVFGNVVRKIRADYSEAMDIARNQLNRELAQSGMDLDSYEKYLTNFYTKKLASGDIEKSIMQNPNISDAAKLLVVNGDINANDLALSQIRNEICSRADKILQNNKVSSSNYSAISDIVCSFYDGKPVDINGIELGAFGHSEEYYARSKVMSYTEVIADFTALKCDPNGQEALEVLGQIIGDDSYDYIEKQYESYVKCHNYTPEQNLYFKSRPSR